MKIAVFISGRIIRYEACLIPFLLKNKDIDIDLFVSINDEDSPYYDKVKTDLKPWLKKIYINKYKLPDDFNHTNPFQTGFIKIDGVFKPLHQMSMYFNDKNSFSLIKSYSEKNNIKYDFVMKYRADIINFKIPDFNNYKQDVLYSIQPTYDFLSHGNYKKKIVSDAWVWGSFDIMEKYCQTYDYVLEQLKLSNGNYYIGFEDCVTDNCYSFNLKIEWVTIPYKLDKFRRIADYKQQRFESDNVWSHENKFMFDTQNILTYQELPVVSE